MKKFQKIFILPAVFAAMLAGCATDNTPKPTVLSEVAPHAIQVKPLWFKTVGNGTSGEYLSLGSTLQGTTLLNASYNGEVTAMNVQNGNILWQTNIQHSISATPGANDTTVFVGTKDGNLYALDINTGKIKWNVALPSLTLGAPTATDDVVVVQCHDSSVVALSSDTGKQIWSYQATQPSLTLYSNSSPVIYNGMVYVGFDSGQLGAFDLYRGVETWQVPIAIQASTEAVLNMVDLDGTPTMDNNILFATSYHGTLSAVNTTQGQIIWQRKNSSFEAPVVQNGKVIVVDETGRVQAFDESTGATLWQLKDLLYRFVSSPATINNEAVVGDYQGYVHFISLDNGKVLARIKVSGGGISAQPIVYNNFVIVTSSDGEIAALEPSE